MAVMARDGDMRKVKGEVVRIFLLLVMIEACGVLVEPDGVRGDTQPILVQFSSARLERLVGPLAIKHANRGQVDSLLLTKGRLYADSFPQNPSDILGSNFYDLAYTLYQVYHRTGDPYWRDRAGVVARAWRDDALNQNYPALFNRDWSKSVPPPRGMSTLGLAVLAAETGDAEAARVVGYHADWVARGLPNGFTSDGRLFLGDQRESAYSLIALVAAKVINAPIPDQSMAWGWGGQWDRARQALLDDILAKQQPDGAWLAGPDSNYPDGTYTINYMTGLLMEALTLYDQVIGDARILPAVERATQWLWQHQWVSGAGAFQYANMTYGTRLVQTPFTDLNGLMLPAWGYAYAKTGNPIYREQGDQILAGMLQPGTDGTYGMYSAKQYAQMFRSSGKYLGWVTAAQ